MAVPKSFIPAFLAVAIVTVPSTWADPENGPSASANTVLVDGSANPGTTLSKLVRGTDAYVIVQNVGTGTFSLVDPDGVTVAAAASVEGQVKFGPVSVAKTGAWTLKLVNVVTSFDVIPFDSGLSVGSAQLMISSISQFEELCDLFQCPPPFYTRGLRWNGFECEQYGFSPGGGTLVYQGNVLYLILTFRTNYTIEEDPLWNAWTILGTASGAPLAINKIHTVGYSVGTWAVNEPQDIEWHTIISMGQVEDYVDASAKLTSEAGFSVCTVSHNIRVTVRVDEPGP